MDRQAAKRGNDGDSLHEPFLTDKEINQPLDVWFFPLELQRMSEPCRQNGTNAHLHQSLLLG